MLLKRSVVLSGWAVAGLACGGQAEAGESLPQTATVAYKGSYTGEVVSTKPQRSSHRSSVDPMKLLSNPSAALGSMSQESVATAGQGKEMFGAVDVALNISGPSVTGTIKSTGTLSSSRVSGVRDGDICKLVLSRSLVFEGECSKARFNGVIRSAEEGRRITTIQVAADIVNVVDVDQKNRALAAERDKRADQAAQEAEARKQSEAIERATQEELLRSLPPVKR